MPTINEKGNYAKNKYEEKMLEIPQQPTSRLTKSTVIRVMLKGQYRLITQNGELKSRSKQIQ